MKLVKNKLQLAENAAYNNLLEDENCSQIFYQIKQILKSK